MAAYVEVYPIRSWREGTTGKAACASTSLTCKARRRVRPSRLAAYSQLAYVLARTEKLAQFCFGI